MSPNQFTCLIPCFNENKRLLKTLKIVTKIPGFDSIICVDDGSTEQETKRILKQVKKLFPQIKFLHKPTNTGKSEAIKFALNHIKTEWVFMLDADLKFLKPSEITQAIQLVKKNTNKLDTLVLRRAPHNLFVRAIRHDILMSGQRIMKTSDLKKVYKNKSFSGYQLEVALNHYALKHQKQAFWFQTSLVNTYKIRKWGLKTSLKKHRDEITSYTSYAGKKAYFDQIENFCRQSVFDLQ